MSCPPPSWSPPGSSSSSSQHSSYVQQTTNIRSEATSRHFFLPCFLHPSCPFCGGLCTSSPPPCPAPSSQTCPQRSAEEHTQQEYKFSFLKRKDYFFRVFLCGSLAKRFGKPCSQPYSGSNGYSYLFIHSHIYN